MYERTLSTVSEPLSSLSCACVSLPLSPSLSHPFPSLSLSPFIFLVFLVVLCSVAGENAGISCCCGPTCNSALVLSSGIGLCCKCVRGTIGPGLRISYHLQVRN